MNYLQRYDITTCDNWYNFEFEQQTVSEIRWGARRTTCDNWYNFEQQTGHPGWQYMLRTLLVMRQWSRAVYACVEGSRMRERLQNMQIANFRMRTRNFLA